MTTVPRIQKNNLKDGDRIFEGILTVNSGIQIGASGLKLPVINVVSQVLTFSALGSGVGSFLQAAFTSGATGIVSSGDYLIPLNSQPNSGFILLPAQTTTGDSIAVNILTTQNVNPGAQTVKVLILKNLGV